MESTNTEEMVFHEKNNSFYLTVALSENKLNIILKDKIESVSYERVYTLEDVGKEIHRNVDLMDIYSAFGQSKEVYEGEKIEGRESEVAEVSFGVIIKNYGLPCYKVENGGKMTVYCVRAHKSKKKKQIYKSRLALTKV